MNFAFYTHFTGLTANRGIRAAAEYASSHGYASVEVLEGASGNPPAIATVDEAKEAGRILGEYGLSVACYSVGATIYKNPRAVESLKRHAELAAALGAPYLHHTLVGTLRPLPELPDFETMLPEVVGSACEVAEYAAGLGLTCLYEEQGAYFNGVERFGRFYNEMKLRRDNIGVCGDFGNSLFVDVIPSDFIKAFAGEIRHVHIKDYLRSDKPMSGWLPTVGGNYLFDCAAGDGAADCIGSLTALRASGYDGCFAIEHEVGFPEPFEGCSDRSRRLIEGLWNEA